MQFSGTEDSEAFTKTFEKLNLTLEDKFNSFKSQDFRRSAEAKKVFSALSTPLLNIYQSLNLEFDELASLWNTYYSEIFDALLDICKNPFGPKEGFELTQVAVMDALVSASLYFTDLKTKIENNEEEGTKESVALFYNIFKYMSSYKYKITEPIYDEFLKGFIIMTLREFIEIIQVEPLLSDPSQPDQRPPISQVLQGILDTISDETLDLIQKERNDKVQFAGEKSENQFYYELAELLLRYATTESLEEGSSKSLAQKFIEEPIQKQVAKFGPDMPLFNNFSLTVFNADKGRMITLSQITPNTLTLNPLGMVKLVETVLFAPQSERFSHSLRAGVPSKNLASADKTTWMENIFDSIKTKTLAQIMIPGAHDAGTFNMNPFYLKSWTECQDKGFLQQLRSGIRYLDCRVVYKNNNSIDKFWFAHGDYDSNTKLQELLDSVKIFLESTSKEIVILDFSHFGSRDTAWNDSYLLEFAGRFSSLNSYIAGRDFVEKTIEELVAQNQRLILLSDRDWPNSQCGKSINNSFWANTAQIKALSFGLDREVNNKDVYQNMYRKDLHLLQAILTPSADILKRGAELVSQGSDTTFEKFVSYLIGPLAGGAAKIATGTTLKSLAKNVAEWAPGIYNKVDWLTKVNVIFSDFVYDNPFVDIAIHANLNLRK